MDRTLFSPFMIDTYRACPRAFEIALKYFDDENRARSIASVCKQFVRKAAADVNKGRVTSANQLQTFIGKHWPLDKMEKFGYDQDQIAKAFLYTYKTLSRYVSQPYRPGEAEVAAVAVKIRARVPHVRVYLEDTFDLLLWYPHRAHLEIVDFELFDRPAQTRQWPSASMVARQFLANKLKGRCPYRTISFTTLKLGPKGFQASSVSLDDETFASNFDKLIEDIEAMRAPSKTEPHASGDFCRYCSSLGRSVKEEDSVSEEDNSFSLSA
ncbi:MAG: hypothetical protein K8F91_18775 [Candidatus Obscuribacterales bacterium]|nr:hypothetical protein [Candidatus Obscuribacterales bacterium]